MRSRGRLLLGAALAVPLLYLFLRGVAWSELTAAFREARPGYLVGVLVATIATYTLRAWRWGYLLAPLIRVPFARLWSATWVGFMTGLLVPRAGEVVRPYLIARRHRTRTSAAFASIILERLCDLLAVVVLFWLWSADLVSLPRLGAPPWLHRAMRVVSSSSSNRPVFIFGAVAVVIAMFLAWRSGRWT